MKTSNKYLFSTLLCLSLFQSCSSGPQEIDYDEDQCHRCKMIISQKQFGAELVTQKGRIYKYDAIECLIPEVIENGQNHYSHLLVTDYNRPGNLISALESQYLVSKELPSPMGGYLSAYSSMDAASYARNRYNGEVYDWQSIVDTFK